MKVVISLGDESAPLKIGASISRNGVALSTNSVRLGPSSSGPILLKVPPNNSNGTADYKLRVEGSYADRASSGIVFVEEASLAFSQKFLSITIR